MQGSPLRPGRLCERGTWTSAAWHDRPTRHPEGLRADRRNHAGSDGDARKSDNRRDRRRAIEENIREMEKLYPDRLKLAFQFDEEMAHLVEAGADIS